MARFLGRTSERRLIKDMDRSPSFGVQIGKPDEKKPEILTLAEIRKLLSTSKELKHPWYHHWAMALLTGMRSGELYALLWTDIDWENSALTVSKSYDNRFNVIKCTKAGYWRTVPISGELRSLLAEIKLQAGERPHVLPRHRMWQMGMQAQELRKFCQGMGILEHVSQRSSSETASRPSRFKRSADGKTSKLCSGISAWQELKSQGRRKR
jgi:integrase